MKEIIRELFEYYYSLRRVVKETIIMGQGQNMQIRIVTQRAAQVWNMLDDRNRPSDLLADNFIEKEKEVIAQEIFTITEDILFRLELTDESSEWDERRSFTKHEDKVSWARRNLMRLDILDPYDRMFLSTIEKSGIPIGFKRKSVELDKEEEEKSKVKKIMKGVGIDVESNY